MASIYRFTRKSKKEDPKAAKAKDEKQNSDDFFPLLFSEDPIPSAPQNEPEISPVLEQLFAPEANGEDPALAKTREISFDKEEELEKTEDAGITRTFQLPLDKKETEAADSFGLPEELMKALQEKKADFTKVDEVFNHTKGTLSGDASEQEYDQTTALLKEVFGSGSDRKKKKKKKNEEMAEAATSSGEASSVLMSEEEQGSDQVAENDSYIAVHDSQDESTKEYHATFSIEEELSKIKPEMQDESIPELAEEVKVPDLDNPYSDTYEELEEKEKRRTPLPEEFSSQEEYDEFAEHLRNCNFKTLCKCIWSFLIFLVILYLESATFSNLYHPLFLQPGGLYNIIYLLIDIQLLLIAALLALPALGQGFGSIFRAKPNRHAATALMLVFALAHPIVLLSTGAVEYPLFGSLAALFLFIGAVSDFLEAKRIHRTFRIFGKNKEKLVATELSEDCAEAEAFREQLEGEPKFFSVHKANFIDGFFGKVKEAGKAERFHGVSILLSFLISCGFAAFSYWKTPDAVLTFTRFVTMAMMTFPLSGALTVVLPFSHISKKAQKKDCAIVSAKAAEEYAACDVVSFTDKEIFPPKFVKVTTIRTYGQTRIDKAILYSAMIFQKLGGPLSHVFKKTISGVVTEIPENFEFQEITADGMCAKIEGKDIFVGNKNYMLSYDFGYTKDEKDEAFEAKLGKIMYMVIGSELAAKFYIRYSISKRFKKTIVALFKCGICPAVKTCDPNIDSDLFRTLLQNHKIPAGIIKTCDAMKDAPAEERSGSGMVCTSTIANLLYGFSLCDALRHLTRSNIMIKILSMLVGAGVVFFLFFIGELTKVTGLFAISYQLLWMIPMIIPSLSE